MDIDFTDETLPLEEELHNFDMRGKSPRLNFFEKDVEGKCAILELDKTVTITLYDICY